MIRRAAAFVAAAMVLAPGCAELEPPGPPVGQTSALTGGVPDAGDEAVVAIMFGDHAACTGVLVAPRIVLTAAHCLVNNAARPRVLFGSSVLTAIAVREVAAIYVPADFSPLSMAHDIAGLRLDADAPGSVPAMVVQDPTWLADAVGAPVRLVGFGHESEAPEPDAPHVKREGTARIAAIGDTAITLTPGPSQACVGDSGGPVFASLDTGGDERLIALVVGGVTSCLDTATALRIDSYDKSFVEPLITGIGRPDETPGSGGCDVGGAPPVAPSGAMLIAILGTLLVCAKGRTRQRPPKAGIPPRGLVYRG